MYSNIPFGHRAENGIDHGMANHIRIRMTRKTHAIWDLHAAKNELTPAAKSMNVETVSYPKLSSHFSSY
jgi:hypothetical protein